MSSPKTNYLANLKLKKSNVDIEFTKDQIEELYKCSNDPFYFIENYIKIVDLEDGLIPFKLYPYQRRMINNFHNNRFTISLVARQSGKTTSYLGYILWYVLFHEQKKVIILAHKFSTATDILSRLKLSYENLPKWLQQGVCEWNKTSLELENGSRVKVDSTSGNASRGESANILVLDEFAMVQNNIAEQFFRSVYPTISKGKTTKIIILSTPHGINLFYKMWQDTIHKKNTFVPFTMHWSEVPGRDEKWKEQEIANGGKDLFLQEYELEFFGSVQNTLISSSILKILKFEEPIHSTNDGLDIYELPIEGHIYITNLDVATGNNKDYSVITMIDVTTIPYKLVAKYRSNKISTLIFPNVIVSLAKKYNNSYILIELNNSGSEVANIIYHELEYENVFSSITDKKFSAQILSTDKSSKHKLGILTSKKTKNIGCLNLKTLIEENKLIIRDFDIISELTTFVSKNTSFSGEGGSTDDLVMSLVLFGWLVQQKYFKEMMEQNIRSELDGGNKEFFSDSPLIFVDDHNNSSLDNFSDNIIDFGDLTELKVKDWFCDELINDTPNENYKENFNQNQLLSKWITNFFK